MTQQFINTYIGTLAAILTIIMVAIGLSKWLRKLWARYFLAKPLAKKVSTDFTLHDVELGMRHLSEAVKAFSPDLIIGINRGGAIIGGILAKHLDRLVHQIIIESKQDVYSIMTDESPIIFSNSDCIAGKKILIVDDRLGSGQHMKAAYDHIRECGGDVRKLVFTWVDHPSPKEVPDIYAYKSNSELVPFPWEPGVGTRWDSDDLV